MVQSCMAHFLEYGVAGTLPPGGYMTNSTDHYLDHAGFRRNTESHDPIEFSYVQIQDATNDFHSSRILGVGGFGVVYRGRLSSGQVSIHACMSMVLIN